MFRWLRRLLWRRKRSRNIYVTSSCVPTVTVTHNPNSVNCSSPITTPSFTSQPTSVPQPVEYNKPNCSTISTQPNTCCTYRKSPYSTGFKKPDKCCHQYVPINTSFCKPNLTCSIETPVPLPEVTCTPSTQTPEVTCTPVTAATCSTQNIDFYETSKVVSGCCDNTPKPPETTCYTSPETTCYTSPETTCYTSPETTCYTSSEPVEVTNTCVTSPPASNPDVVTPQDGCIYVMNGYGINLMVDGCPAVGYLDTGRDMNFTPGEQVELYQYNGNLNCCSATVQSATDTERKGTNDEILVQVKKVTTCNECRS